MSRPALTMALASILCALALVALILIRFSEIHPLRSFRRLMATRRARKDPGVRPQIEVHGRPTPLTMVYGRKGKRAAPSR